MGKLLPDVASFETNGTRWLTFNPCGYIMREIIKKGSYQPEITSKCIEEIGDSTKDVLDIGANVGSFAVPVGKAIKGKVFSFECQSAMAKVVFANALVNRLGNVVPIHAAVVDEVTEPFINIPVQDYDEGIDIGGFSLDPENNTMKNYIKFTGELEQVRQVTIDEFGFKNVGFVKIDVEGLELRVIKGMHKTLEDNGYPPILFECSELPEFADQRAELMEHVQNLGYKIERVSLDNYLAKFK